MSITKSILDIAIREMAASGMRTLKALRIRVGVLTAVEPEALRFCFDASIKGTPMEGAVLEIEETPLAARCLDCSTEFRVSALEHRCPGCASTRVEGVSGHELDVISIEGE